MPNLNSNDYKILECIINKEKNRGMSRGRGSTIKQLQEATGFSDVKIRNTLKVLLEMELIEEAVKKVKAKAYYVNEKGFNELLDLRKNIF